MKMRWVLAAAVAIVGTSSVAAAEEQVIREAEKTVYKEKTEVVFSGVEVDGNIARPEIETVVVQPKSRFDSMLKHRKSFGDELRESVDD
jgi:hypothetical protein